MHSLSVKSLLAYYQSFRQLNNIDRYLKQSAPGDTSQDLPSSPKVTHIYCIILKNYPFSTAFFPTWKSERHAVLHYFENNSRF